MSWVANVVLFYSNAEEYGEIEEGDEDSIDYLGPSPCLANVNEWLRKHDRVELVDLSEPVGGKDRHGFECCIWGAAINHLDIPAFLQFVAEQPWQDIEGVQVMIKDQEDPRFKLYELSTVDA